MKRARMSRRDFLRTAAFASSSLAFSRLLAACSPQPTAAPATSVPATAVPTSAPQIGGELKYVGWEGYDAIDPDAFPTTADWLADNGVRLASTYIGNNEEMFTKIRAAGPGAYDLCTPYIGVLRAWIESDILEPIDTSRLTNFPDVFDEFKGIDVTMQGSSQYAVPFTWAPAAQLYNADVIPEPPASWLDLLEPQYTGRIVTIDGHDGFFTVMALAKGFRDPDPHHLTLEQLEECKELGRQFMAQIKTVAPSYGEEKNILVSGEADITLASWSAVAGWAQAEGANIQTNIPSEGSLTYIDAFAIPKGAPNMNTALAFIDHMLSPQVQADMANYVTQGVVNREAVALLPESLQESLNHANLSDVLNKAPAYPPIPDESDTYATYADWLEAWEELKAGQ